MLAPLLLDLLITCTLILLAGWAYDSASHDVLVGHSPSPSSAHAAASPAWFAAHDALAGRDWPRGMNQIGLRDLEQEGWWG
jgi:hypothetical protein